MKVLNVGGSNKGIPIPPQYSGWQHGLLDIDPLIKPDILCDARELKSLAPAEYNAVYCSRNLEYYYRHDVPRVLSGFKYILKEGGLAHICVPNIEAVMRTVIETNMDIDDVLYQAPLGPITVKDVIYGHGGEIEKSGNDFYAHKTGFTPNSLIRILNECGFPYVFTNVRQYEVIALAFIIKPVPTFSRLFGLPENLIQWTNYIPYLLKSISG